MGRPAHAVFCEHGDVGVTYCSGVASVLVDGGNLHFSFYQTHIAGDGSQERVIVARLILSMAAFLQTRATVDFELAANFAETHEAGTGLTN